MLPSFISEQQIRASLEEHIHKFKKKADSRWNAACNSPGNSLPRYTQVKQKKSHKTQEDSFYGKHCKHAICSPTSKENILNWKQG